MFYDKFAWNLYDRLYNAYITVVPHNITVLAFEIGLA